MTRSNSPSTGVNGHGTPQTATGPEALRQHSKFPHLGGTGSPIIVDLTGSFSLALVLAAAVSVAGAIIYLAVVQRPITEADLT